VKPKTVDLASDHGHHVKGTPYHFHHGWVPITPEMKERKRTRASLKKNPIRASHVVDMWNQANEDEKLEGENWYKSAHDLADAMAKKYGFSTKQAAGIIAVYSPQTGWGTNLTRAATVLRTRKAIGGKGSGVMATTRQKANAERILAGENYDNVIKGKKINNFAHLIENGGDVAGEAPRVVIDRHAIGVTRGIPLTEKQYTIDRPASVKRYEKFSDAYREAAKQISKQEGRTISAHQVQAATWLTRQRLNKSANRGKARNTRGLNDWKNWVEYASKQGLGAGGKAGVGYELSAPQGQTIDVSDVSQPPKEDETIQHIAEILLAGYAANKAIALLTKLLVPLGLTAAAIRPAYSLAMSGSSAVPNARLAVNGLKKAGDALKRVRYDDLYYRAAYMFNAAGRISKSLNEKKPLRVALTQESVFYRQHEKARRGRLDAAARVQAASKMFGPLLGWYLNPLLNNEGECIAANGHNFYADEGTVIGFPGSVHSNCGCKAGPPHEGAEMVNDVMRNLIVLGKNRKFKVKATKSA
jgi:hypothetical protein